MELTSDDLKNFCNALLHWHACVILQWHPAAGDAPLVGFNIPQLDVDFRCFVSGVLCLLIHVDPTVTFWFCPYT